MPVCPIREKRTRKAPAGLVPAIRHGETVVHEIAGRVQHVAEQLRIALPQVVRHLVIGRRETGGDGRGVRCAGNRKRIIRTFHQTVAEGTDIFREALDRVAGLVEVRVGERCNQAVRQ